jgi:glutathione S-transferase/dienelactone hydrolase
MAVCCPSTAHGFMSKSYVCKGTEKVLIGGVEAYVAGNPCPCSTKGTKAIILVSDVWGYAGGHTRAIADMLASDVADFVVVPRMLSKTFEGGTEGDGLPPGFDMEHRRSEFIEWIKTYSYEKDWAPLMKSTMTYAKSMGAVHIGLLGYCFGGMITTLTAMEDPAVSCMVVSHPSMQLWEKGFGKEAPHVMAEKVTAPTLLHPAGDDDPTYFPGGATMNALRKNSLSSRSEPFPMMKHGFMTRGNTDDASISRDVDACLRSTSSFFKEQFNGTPKIRLTYFAIPGRAESTRLALTIGGIDFIDERITAAEWAERKATKPTDSLKQLPLLEVNGQELGQSKAVLRYAGKVAGLYPPDPFIAAQVDLVLDSLDDRLQLFQPTFGISDPAMRIAARKEIAGALPPTGDRTAALRFQVVTQALNDRVGANLNGFVAGPSLTIADLALFCDQSPLNGGFLEGIDESCFLDEQGQHRFPHLVAHRHRIANLPAVKKFYFRETTLASSPANNIRLQFRPDPITIGYWAIQGLAAPLRMMVLFAEVPLRVRSYKTTQNQDGSYNKDSWMKNAKPLLAKKHPLINLPYVIDGEMVVSQSNACLAYLGRRLGLWGRTFKEEVECEELLCEVTDLRDAMVDYAYGNEGELREAAVALMTKVNATSFPKLNGHFCRMKSGGYSGTFLVGDHATAPDFHLWNMLHQFDVLSKVFGLDCPVDEKGAFPCLANFYKKFKALPNNARYLASSLHTQMPFNSKYARFGSALPDGATYVPGSSTPEPDFNGLY